MWIPKYCKFDKFYQKKTIVEDKNDVIYQGILHKIYKSKFNEWGIILHVSENNKDINLVKSVTITASLIKNVKVLFFERKVSIHKSLSNLKDSLYTILEFDDDYISI